MGSRLEVRMMHYFILILMAAGMIGIEFYVEIGKYMPSGTDTFNDPETILLQLRNKIVVMFIILTIVVAIVMIMFIRNITTPLVEMIDAAREINNGDLSRIISTDTNDEISQLGETLNALTSNLQETASLSSSISQQALEAVYRLRTKYQQGKIPDESDIRSLEQSLGMLSEFSESFSLLKS